MSSSTSEKAETMRIVTSAGEFDVFVQIRKTSDDWLVCVHGWGGSKDCFQEVFERSEFVSMSICTVDLLGFGDSDRPRNFSYSLGEQAKVLEQIVRLLKPRRVFLVGHSMGGGVALLAAPMLGDVLAKFVSVEGCVGLPNGSTSGVIANLPCWMAVGLALPTLRFLASCAPSAKVRRVGSWLRHADGRAFYRSAQSLQSYIHSDKLLNMLAALPSKTYICGDKSGRWQSVAPHLREKNIEVKVVPRAGHVIMLDNPDDFYQMLAETIIER